MGVGLIITMAVLGLGGVGISYANKYTNLQPWTLHTFRFKQITAPTHYRYMMELCVSVGYQGSNKPRDVFAFYSSLSLDVQKYFVQAVLMSTQEDMDVGQVITALAADPKNAVSTLSSALGTGFVESASINIKGAGLYNNVTGFLRSYWKVILGFLLIVISFKRLKNG